QARRRTIFVLLRLLPCLRGPHRQRSLDAERPPEERCREQQRERAAGRRGEDAPREAAAVWRGQPPRAGVHEEEPVAVLPVDRERAPVAAERQPEVPDRRLIAGQG